MNANVSVTALLPRVIEAVHAAADMLVAEAQRTGGPRGGGSKAEVDTDIEQALRRALMPLLDGGFAGEETGTTPAPTPEGFLWLVDPHDGTSEFLRGYRGSAVSVALLRAGQPVLGVVCAPLSPDRGFDLIAWAEGAPVTRNGAAIDSGLGSRGLSASAYVFLNPRAARMAELNAALVAPGRFIGMPSIAYRLARVAAGDGVATMSLHGLHAWDFAGGHALLRGAGGVVLDELGRDVRYDPLSGVSLVKRCFAGAPPALAALAARDWDRIEKSSSGPLRLQLSWPRPVDALRLDRAYGALLGLAAAPGRRQDATDAQRSLETPRAVTELAVALARSLVRRGGYDAEDAGRCYARWRQSSGATEKSLAHIAPLGVLAAGDPELAARLARQDARLSGAAPRHADACAVYAASLSWLIGAGTAVDAAALLELARTLLIPASPGAAALFETLRRAVAGAPAVDAPRADRTPAQARDAAEDSTDPARTLVRGLCAGFRLLTLPAAGAGADASISRREGAHGADAPGDAVPWHLLAGELADGGDSAASLDAAAAVAGALVGARTGAAAMHASSLAFQATRAVHGGSGPVRPDEYWPDELPVLADALLATAQRDPPGHAP